MSAITDAIDRAELTLVSNDRINRGTSIRRRRLAHGIRSVRDFAERTGLSRDAITGAEKGSSKTTEVTYERLEAWLDDYDHKTQLDTRASDAGEVVPPGAVPSTDASTDLSMAPDVVEVEVEGPSTKWRVRFRGHADEADSLREQAQKLLRDMDSDN